MTVTTVRLWPKNQPIPKGWKLASKLEGSHHAQRAVLIEKCSPPK